MSGISSIQSWLRQSIVVVCALWLAACDQQPDSVATTGAPASLALEQNHAAPSTERFIGQALRLVDVSEQQLEGVGTLVLSFSVPLAQQEFADFITVTDETTAQVLEPAWLLSADAMELHLRHLPPGHRLKLRVNEGLSALTGVRLQQAHSSVLNVRKVEPMLGFASKGSLLPIELAQGLPVMSLNVSEVDVDFFRIHDQRVAAFVSEYDSSSFSVWSNQQLQNSAKLVYSGRFALPVQENAQQRSLLPLKNIEQLQQPGIYYAVMRQAGNLSYSQPATLFSLSDIGLSVRKSAASLDIFTQSIASGRKLSGVQIQLLDRKGRQVQPQQAVTDADGYLRLHLPTGKKEDEQPVLLLAQHSQQTSFLSLRRSALDLSEFANLDGSPAQDKQLFVFAARDLYRPGETVKINALLRDQDGQPLAAQPILTEILSPDGKQVRNFLWQPQEAGFYQYELQLADSAPTGRWQLVFELGANKVRHEIQVEDFMPERMALELSGSAQPLTPEQQLLVEVSGRFLYGAAAVGSQVQGQLFVRPLREALASWPGYVFGSVTEELQPQSHDFTTQITDSEGKAQLSLASQWQDAKSPLELVSRVSLLESGGRPIMRRQLQAVWPAPELVGIRAHFANQHAEQNSTAVFSLIKANAKGELLAANNLQVRLIRERHDYYWSYSESGGWTTRFSQKNYQVQQQQVSLDGKQPHELSFPVQYGSYVLEVEDPATGLVTSERFWAGYRHGSDEGLRPDQLSLQLDRAAYANGETALVRVQAPHAGSGYLVVESADGVLWWQNIDVPEQGLDVRVPVKQDWQRHDLYISALVVRPGERDAKKTVKRAVGVVHLPLERNQRQLQVELEASANTRPEQELPLRVRVLDANGRVPHNGRVLLSAVDVGVLNITDFKTPDPLASFFGRKAYALDQMDVYGQLIDVAQAGMARLRFGGDAAMEQGGSRPKTHVQIVAWQSEPLTLDSEGYAVTSMQLPEFNGQLRLVAHAWTADSFASAEQPITVTAPLVSELTLPRFLARDDRSLLNLELHNMSGQPQQLTLELITDELVQLEQELPTQISLQADERLRLAVPIRAVATGTASFNLKVDGMELPNEQLQPLQRNWKLDIRSAFAQQSQRITRLIQPGESWQTEAGWLKGWHQPSLTARFELSSRPMTSIAELVRSLYEYPYGCSEQTASRLLPVLHLSAQRLSSLLEREVSPEQRQTLLQNGVDHLLSMQRHDGSFAMWNANGAEIVWNTVLAADFLQQAHAHGLQVPAERLEKTYQRLLRYVRESYLIDPEYTDSREHSRFATQSYAAYVLSRQQALPLSALRAIHTNAEHAKTPLALVHLAVALNKAGDSVRANELLQKAAVMRRDNRLWLQDYGSELSDFAWQFYVLNGSKLLTESQQHQRLEQMIDLLHAKRWLSTQENAAVFMALNSAGLSSDEAWQAQLQTASRKLGLSDQRPAQLLHHGDLQSLQLHNQSQQSLYQVLNLRGEPVKYEPQPNNVLRIKRYFYNLDGSLANLAQIDSGSLLLVMLEVEASQRVSDALVVDLLPAGFELENQNLAHGSVLLDEVPAFKDWLAGMNRQSIAMQSFMDDRYVAALSVDQWSSGRLLYLVRAVTPGQYRLPPVQVQSMYRPAWQAEYANQHSIINIR